MKSFFHLCKVKVSIITITFNSSKTLQDTIDAVNRQSYRQQVEYILIDGLSNDNTMEIVKANSEKIDKYISEKDNGLYDALNKGIALAGGDVIGILHSDDVYWDEKVIEDVVKKFEETDCDAVYGDLCYVKENDVSSIVRKWISGVYKEGMFLNGWMPPHPAFFVKKECYTRYGLFNLELKSAADYELMLRFIHKHKIRLSYISRFLVRMRVGGKSNVTIKNRIKANLEDRKAWRMNNLKARFYTLWLKPLRKIFQFI
jgi:glycosyltransferase involved in cell wall biosynthesis